MLLVSVDPGAAHRPEPADLGFRSRLQGDERSFQLLEPVHQLSCTTDCALRHKKMIAQHEHERIPADPVADLVHGVAKPALFILRTEDDPAAQVLDRRKALPRVGRELLVVPWREILMKKILEKPP